MNLLSRSSICPPFRIVASPARTFWRAAGSLQLNATPIWA
jgi:hypothetical protein